MNIIERADKYADGKANEAITQAIAKAYMDGYRDGYNDREAEIPVDFRNNKTTYIDLGLPSRTLWASDYEMNDNKLLFLPYEKAEYSKLPTVAQWEELRDNCKWEYCTGKDTLYWAKCIGPNGNILTFNKTGKINADSLSDEYKVYFWLEENQTTKAVKMYKTSNCNDPYKSIFEMFSGYHLPVRLVR